MSELELEHHETLLNDKENEVEWLKKQLYEYQSLLFSKKSVLADLKHGYEYTLDTYQSKQNKKICNEIDDILAVIGKVQNDEEDNSPINTSNKRTVKMIKKNTEDNDSPMNIIATLNKNDSVKVMTNKIIHSTEKVVNPNLHTLKTYVENEAKQAAKSNINDNTFENTFPNESTLDSSGKLSRSSNLMKK